MKNKEYRNQITLLGREGAGPLGSVISREGWARAAGLAGVVAVGFALAELTWRLVSTPSVGELPVPSALLQQNSSAAHLSIAELTDARLFGVALAQPGGTLNAPETTLNLILRGIFAIDNRRALAIIASGGADEQPYKVGDVLPGGAVVHEIAVDRVILERGGRFETLTLPREAVAGTAPAPLDGGTAAVSPNAPLAEIRNHIKVNPSEALAMNAVRPVMENGHIKGYQLADNPYMPALREAGLMPGDVVMSVNGIPVTDQARASEVLNHLSNAQRLDLEVERGGVTTSLSVNLAR